MKLAKALKVKNRLAGEIALAQSLISASNVVEGANQPPHNVDELYGELVRKQEKLATLKASIAIANAPIWSRITLMAELKSRIAWLRTLPTKEGTFTEGGGFRVEPRPVTYRATIKAVEVERDVKLISTQIERLQDEIDEHNASTQIAFEI